MSIEEAYRSTLKRLRKEAKKNIKDYARKNRLPYNTIKMLIHEESTGSIKTWIRVERAFARNDRKNAPVSEVDLG